ncbi:hypothetical protein ACVWYH_006556 [Bradyrhizobium sp. GM24.11]
MSSSICSFPPQAIIKHRKDSGRHNTASHLFAPRKPKMRCPNPIRERAFLKETGVVNDRNEIPNDFIFLRGYSPALALSTVVENWKQQPQ